MLPLPCHLGAPGVLPPPHLQYQDLFIPIKHKEKGLYI